MTLSTSFATLLPLAIRDTALTVASLQAGDFPDEGFTVFRKKCEEQLQRLRAELKEAGHPDDVVDDALYAQCALLDETVLRCLKNEHRDTWEHQPLQVAHFNSHDAGEELIKRMQALLDGAQPNVTLLLIFHTVLLLGFKGKFAVQGETERLKLMAGLTERIEANSQKQTPDDCSTVVVTTGGSRRWRPLLSPLAWLMLAALAAVLLYGGLQHWLSVSIATFTHQ